MKGDANMYSEVMITDQRDEIKNLKQQIYYLQYQLDILTQKNIQLQNSTLLCTGISDLYPGEQHDFLISVLEQLQKKCAENSRAKDIIDSLLQANTKVGTATQMLEILKRIFKNEIPSKASDIAELEKMGFRYLSSKKHPKLVFHEKYRYVMPSTPSDSRHAGKNCFSIINKCIASSIKI